MTNLDSILKRHYFTNEGPSCQGYGFSSGRAFKFPLFISYFYWWGQTKYSEVNATPRKDLKFNVYLLFKEQ